jgi:hypothetical protein
MSAMTSTDDLGNGAWTHIGRAWSNGEPFLALDGDLVPEWRATRDQCDALFSLSWSAATIRLHSGTAGIINFDGTVNDCGWLELFRNTHNQIAIVQAVGSPYPDVLRQALAYPPEQDDATVVVCPSGTLVVWSSTLDGLEHAGSWLQDARAGQSPMAWDAGGTRYMGGVRISHAADHYRLRIRSATELGRDRTFARWTLRPYTDAS